MERILVHHIGCLGDTIVAIPALRAIRRHYGRRVHIALLHCEYPATLVGPVEVLAGSGLVDEFLSYPAAPSRTSTLRLRRSIASHRFSTVIYLMRGERTRFATIRDRLFFLACGIRRGTGFRMPRFGSAHQSEYLFERLQPSICLQPEDSAFPLLSPSIAHLERARAVLGQIRRHPERPLIAIAPGTKVPSKQWPVDRFTEIAKRLDRSGEFEVVLVGGPADQAAAGGIIAAVPGTLSCCGELHLLETAAVIAGCELLISLDTGTTHLGAAMGTRCVTIHGGQFTRGLWDPMGTNHIVVRPLPDHPSIETITVDQVWAAVESSLALATRTAVHR